MNKTLTFAAVAFALLALGACVAGSGEAEHAAAGSVLQQFLLGLWHGIIAPVTLIIEIINRLSPHSLPWTLHVFEVSATGAPYDAGFYLGLIGSPSVVWTRWSRRSEP